MTTTGIRISIDAPNPAWEPGAVDHVVDDFLTRFNHGIAHIGLRAERTPAAGAGDDFAPMITLHVGGRDGVPAVLAFEENLIGHGSSPCAPGAAAEGDGQVATSHPHKYAVATPSNGARGSK